MKKILLSAVSTPVSASYIKHLKNKGYYVLGVDIAENEFTKSICDEFVIVHPVSEPEDYIKDISELDFDLFFPWLDEEHILFANRTENVPFYEKIVTSEPSSILKATDKEETYQFCIENDINVAPKTEEAPAFVRKRFGRGSKGAFLETDSKRLKLLSDKKNIKQKFIPGTEYTVDILCDLNGEIIFQVPRIRTQASNVSVTGKIDMNKEIMAFTKEVCSKIAFKGCINIQVMFYNGEIFLIEINPRLAGSSILSIKGGFDLLVDSIKLFSSQALEKKYEVEDGLKMIRYYNEYFT